MPVKNSFDKKTASGSPGNGNAVDTFSFLFKPAILGVITFCLLVFLFTLLIYQRYALLREAKIREASEIVNEAKDKLQETLTHSLSATKTLTFFIDNNGQVKDFDSIAAQILETASDIDAIQLVPGGVIRYVYPLKGNEKVLGYDILKDSTRNKEAYKAIAKKQMFFAGPFELRQGGMGVVGRLPVYRKNKFWGFSAVVIKMSTLFKTAGIDSVSNNGFYFQLSKINPDTKTEEYFLPLHKDQAKSKSVSVRVPNGEWKLSVIRLEQYNGFGDIALLALLGFLLSLSGAVLVYRIALRPRMLDRLVKEKTIDLKKSENKYRSVIERVSDAFVAIDKDWVYTYINEKGGEIFAREPKSLIGKNIWAEFPEWIDKPFYHAYYRAMETQEYQYLEEYYSPYGKWFENHIYPSKDGLTIFFKDVTEIKNISLALKENEEKYRSLIEQASDGIVLSDLEGNILEVNRSLSLMSGYSIEEMEGEHLYRFLPEEDVALNPLRFKELMEGKSLLSERRLLKKDGTTLDIEVNSKMASSQTMIGFIRDITERKKNENILRYQARLLESVSDAITSLDMNRCIVSWNQACEDLYGFTTEEVMGKRIPELVTFEFPGTAQEEVFKQVFSEGKWRGEFNFIHPKTNMKTHLLSSINLLRNMAGDISGFIITSKDITDRKKAELARIHEEQTRQLIMNSTMDAIICINTKGAITLWNPQAEKTFGWNEGEIKGRQLAETIIPKLYREQHNKGMKHYLQTGDGPVLNKMIEITALNRQGMEFPIELSIIPLEQDDQQLFCAFIRDITERKKAEEKLVEKEKRMEQVLSSTADNFYVIDRDYRVVIINKVAEKNLETAWGKLIKPGTNLLDVIPENSDEPIRENFERAFAGERFEYEMQHNNPDLPAWVLIRFTPVVNESGIIIGVSVVAKDISESKKAEVLIKDSEERYRILVENAPEALVVFDVGKQKFISVSETATKLFNMSKEELLRVGPVAVSPEYQPDGRLSAEAAMENIQKTIDGEKPAFEWTHCDKDGNLIPCEVWLVRLPSENEILIRGTIIDITERKKAEEEILTSRRQFQNLVENISGVYWVNNLETYETLYISPSYETIWGLKCEDLYKNPADFINAVHPEDRAILIDAHENIANTHKANLTYRIIRPDGEIRWVSANTNVVIDTNGDKIEYGYAEDITKRKQAEEVLEESERFLKETQVIAKLGTYTLDITFGKWTSSEILDNIFGIDPGFDKTVENWQTIIHPDWRKIMMDYFIEDVIGSKTKFDKEYKIIRINDQTERWVHGIGWLKFNDAGEPIFMVGTIQDISERKQAEEEIFQSEQKYRLLFYNNPLPMWMTTIPDLDIIDVNDAAIKQYGYSREEFLKLNTRQLRPAEDVENFLNEVDKMEPGRINIRNWRHKKKDGSVIHVETYSHQILYEGKWVWLGLSHDITEEYQAKELLEKSYEDIRELASNLQSIREDERTNIAREIHDELGQQLTGLKMDLHWLTRKINSTDDEVNNKMKESIELINATIASVRKISTDLRPSILDDLGLIAALEWQSEEFEKRSGTRVEFTNKAGDITVKPAITTAIFRIYQELLTNIARHANADLVTALLKKENDKLYFRITDNGSGFNLESISNKKTLGLLGIKERTLLLGGTYEFKSKPGEGSETIISIPLTGE